VTRLGQLAVRRLQVRRALGSAKNLQELEAKFRAAFVQCDWREARGLSEQLQAIDPRPPPTAEQLEAVREKFRRLVAEAYARVEATKTLPG